MLTDGQTDGRTDGQKIGRLYRTLLQAGAIKSNVAVINSRALTGEKPCINKTIHALLMHGYATFNMIIPGPQICCHYEMPMARP